MRMTTRGNFEDMHLERMAAFPALSVRPVILKVPEDPAFHRSPNAIMHTRLAKSSRAAMHLNGSPRENAQLAFFCQAAC